MAKLISIIATLLCVVLTFILFTPNYLTMKIYDSVVPSMNNKNQKIVNVGNIRMYVLKVILRVI